MPFKSAAQRRFLFAKHPKMAKRWAREEKAVSKSLVELAKAVKLPDGSWVRLRSGVRKPGLHEIGGYRKGKNMSYMTLREDRLPSGALGRKERLVHHIKVEPEFQRKGIATAMWDRAEKAKLNPMHNWGHQSDAGKAWARTTS